MLGIAHLTIRHHFHYVFRCLFLDFHFKAIHMKTSVCKRVCCSSLLRVLNITAKKKNSQMGRGNTLRLMNLGGSSWLWAWFPLHPTIKKLKACEGLLKSLLNQVRRKPSSMLFILSCSHTRITSSLPSHFLSLWSLSDPFSLCFLGWKFQKLP